MGLNLELGRHLEVFLASSGSNSVFFDGDNFSLCPAPGPTDDDQPQRLCRGSSYSSSSSPSSLYVRVIFAAFRPSTSSGSPQEVDDDDDEGDDDEDDDEDDVKGRRQEKLLFVGVRSEFVVPVFGGLDRTGHGVRRWVWGW